MNISSLDVCVISLVFAIIAVAFGFPTVSIALIVIAIAAVSTDIIVSVWKNKNSKDEQK